MELACRIEQSCFEQPASPARGEHDDVAAAINDAFIRFSMSIDDP